MDELEERRQMDVLIAEQDQDDRTVMVAPEFPDAIPYEALDNFLGVMANGEVISFRKPEKGTILTGTAPWHGTIRGYKVHGCRRACCRDAQAKHQAEYRRRRNSA